MLCFKIKETKWHLKNPKTKSKQGYLIIKYIFCTDQGATPPDTLTPPLTKLLLNSRDLIKEERLAYLEFLFLESIYFVSEIRV